MKIGECTIRAKMHGHEYAFECDLVDNSERNTKLLSALANTMKQALENYPGFKKVLEVLEGLEETNVNG